MLEKILLRIMAICSLILFVLEFVYILNGVITHVPEWKVALNGLALIFTAKFSWFCFDKIDEIGYREQSLKFTWAEEETEE